VNHRTLGRTGIKVTPYALGAMMFGAVANTDHDEGDPDHPIGWTPGIKFVEHRRLLLEGESAEIGGKALKGRRERRRCAPPRRTCRWARTRTCAATRAGG